MATPKYPETKILSRIFDVPESWTLKVAREHGAYQSLEKALKEMTPEQVIAEVKTSRLRGRGGAGFPTGVKWGFVPKQTEKPVYICCNADESEPGTFKDRYLMEHDPHLVIEGCLLAAYAVARRAHLDLRPRRVPALASRASSRRSRRRPRRTSSARRSSGTDFSCDCVVHTGAGAYICGEETGLLESLEGKRGHPRIKPPFPAVEGAFALPDGHQQRRDPGARPVDRRERRAGVRRPGHRSPIRTTRRAWGRRARSSWASRAT